MLGTLGINRPQLIDLGLLVGTDFHPGIRGIGPKRALALVERRGAIDEMPPDVRAGFGADLPRFPRIFLEPEVSGDYQVEQGACDVSKV